MSAMEPEKPTQLQGEIDDDLGQMREQHDALTITAICIVWSHSINDLKNKR